MVTNVVIEYEAFNLDISPEINKTPQIKTYVRIRCLDCQLSEYGPFMKVMDILTNHLRNRHALGEPGETATEYIKKHPNMWSEDNTA